MVVKCTLPTVNQSDEKVETRVNNVWMCMYAYEFAAICYSYIYANNEGKILM